MESGWVAKDGPPDRCLHAFDLARRTQSDLFCLPAWHRIFTVRAAAGGFTLVETAGRDLTSCRTAYRVPLTGPAQQLGPRSCDVLYHARIGDWDLWSPDKDLEPDTVLKGRSAAGGTVELGPIRMNSLVTCGTHAYWTRVSDRGYEIVRWAPGGDAVEIVYRTETVGPDALLYNPHCNQDVLATGTNSPPHPAATSTT